MNNLNQIIKDLSKIFVLLMLFPFFKINNPRIITINNLIDEQLYQKNQDFSNFKTKYKIITIYYPQTYNNSYVNKKNGSRIQNTDDNKQGVSLIEQNIKLAKIHGIYGFAIVYNWLDDFHIYEGILNLFSYNYEVNFSFFLILNFNVNYYNQILNSLIHKPSSSQNDSHLFIDNLGNYLKTKNYIKLEGKPVLGFFDSELISPFIKNIRNLGIKNGRDSIYILCISNGEKTINISDINYKVEFPSKKKILNNGLSQHYFYHFYYYNLWNEENIKSKYIKNFFIINGSHPEKFYIIFKKYLSLLDQGKDTFILFNAWNNYEENCFLEPTKEFGFSYLNYLSKAIFNINDGFKYDLNYLNTKSIIAIQVHLFYEDLLEDIIIKTNNIPVKFDLFISIVFPELRNKLINYIKRYSKSNSYEILIVENKGRDILPFFNQMKTKFKFYKYICHIHTKKSLTEPETGSLWRNYLFNNLLGNKEIISEILYDFENNEKLGFIFPETFYGIIKHFYKLTEITKKWMNFLSLKLFPHHKIDELINFPAGNMFWSKVDAIFQLFIYDFSEYFPNEGDQTNDTIMHGIERIWLYLVIYNGFYYKTIFRFF